MAELHNSDEWLKRDEAMRCLEDRIAKYGLLPESSIKKQIKMNFCMADSGTGVTILPDGNIGLCEHFSETELIGHIGRDSFDDSMVASWKETMPEIPECATCFYYPDCIMLKKCANGCVCFEILRQEQLRKTKRQMVHAYRKWQANEALEEIEEDNFDE